MRVVEIKTCDIANGTGVRTSVFVAGCRHRCEGCFNPEAWSFDAGEEVDEEEVLRTLEPPYVNGISILGGEPLEPENQKWLAPFLEKVRERFPDKDVWMWTGFTLEWLKGSIRRSRADTEYLDRILACVDVLVDGPFDLGSKDPTLRFRGSSNQRIIDLRASLESGVPTPWSDGPVMSSHTWE